MASGATSVAEPVPEAAATAHIRPNTESTATPRRRRLRVRARHSASAADGVGGVVGDVDVTRGEYTGRSAFLTVFGQPTCTLEVECNIPNSHLWTGVTETMTYVSAGPFSLPARIPGTNHGIQVHEFIVALLGR
jgi:hypothetical protein